MRCNACKRENPDDATHCLNCGSVLRSEGVREEGPDTDPIEEKPEAEESSAPGGEVRGVDNGGGGGAPSGSSRATLIIVISVIACLAIACLAGTTIYFASRWRSAETETEELEDKNEELTERNESIGEWLDKIDSALGKAIENVEELLAEEGEELTGWRKTLVESLQAVRDVIEVAREFM